MHIIGIRKLSCIFQIVKEVDFFPLKRSYNPFNNFKSFRHVLSNSSCFCNAISYCVASRHLGCLLPSSRLSPFASPSACLLTAALALPNRLGRVSLCLLTGVSRDSGVPPLNGARRVTDIWTRNRHDILFCSDYEEQSQPITFKMLIKWL